MNDPQVTIYGRVDAALIERLRETVTGMRNLGHVLAWGVTATPPRKPETVITQDEYTHDVVMRFSDGVYAVFDVT